MLGVSKVFISLPTFQWQIHLFFQGAACKQAVFSPKEHVWPDSQALPKQHLLLPGHQPGLDPEYLPKINWHQEDWNDGRIFNWWETALRWGKQRLPVLSAWVQRSWTSQTCCACSSVAPHRPRWREHPALPSPKEEGRASAWGTTQVSAAPESHFQLWVSNTKVVLPTRHSGPVTEQGPGHSEPTFSTRVHAESCWWAQRYLSVSSQASPTFTRSYNPLLIASAALQVFSAFSSQHLRELFPYSQKVVSPHLTLQLFVFYFFPVFLQSSDIVSLQDYLKTWESM